jgi:hypothetical protein
MVKFKNKTIFFVILIGIAGINVFYQLTSPFKLNNQFLESEKISFESSNNSIKQLKQFKINMTQIIEFDEVNEKYCNSKSKVLTIVCLEKLSELDGNASKILKMEDENMTKCDKCIRRVKDDKIVTIFHHTFWQLNEIKSQTSHFYRRTIFLNIMSFLTTQKLCCTKFIFWKLKEFPKEIETEIRKTFKHFFEKDKLEIKLFDLRELCSNRQSSFKNSFVCDPNNAENLASQHLISLSDLVRFVVLDVYGGIYTGITNFFYSIIINYDFVP